MYVGIPIALDNNQLIEPTERAPMFKSLVFVIDLSSLYVCFQTRLEAVGL